MFEKLGMYLQYEFVQNAVIVCVLVALCASLLGVTLVLKRFSFIGDGLSHVAFGAMAVAAVVNLTDDMLLILPVTIASAVLLLLSGCGTGGNGTDMSYDSIDIDLTERSDTVVYAEVYNMLTNPQDYLGKVVRMNGVFYVSVDTETNAYYYMCVVQDVTACCALDIEFVLDGKHDFPNDYPELETDITVIGVFDTYEENGHTYCTLCRAKLL